MKVKANEEYGLRNFPAACAPTEAVSPLLSGDFGPANVEIVSVAATDPDNRDIIYGTQDLITITFNRDTNLGWGPSGNLPLEKVVLKPDLDAVFEWSQDLGFNYTGIWQSRQVLVITILDSTGATPPAINGLIVKVRESGNLRNYPPSAAPSTSSGVLTGNWGMQLPYIIGFIGADPQARDSVYGAGDTLTFLFDRDTDTATLGFGKVGKSVVDDLFLFSRSIGADYTGQWANTRTFVITIVDPAGTRQPMLRFVFARCRNDETRPRSLIKEADGSEGACYDFSPRLDGDFGPNNISIVATATPWVNKTRLGYDSVYMPKDTITLDLDQDTNMGNWDTEAVLTPNAVNKLLWFSRSIGSQYQGRWHSRRKFVITLISVQGADEPLPDVLQVAFRNASDVRNWYDSMYLSVREFCFVVASTPTLTGGKLQATAVCANERNGSFSAARRFWPCCHQRLKHRGQRSNRPRFNLCRPRHNHNHLQPGHQPRTRPATFWHHQGTD